jgi:hypothetical protein
MMRVSSTIVLVCAALFGAGAAGPDAGPGPVRFEAVDVYVETGDEPLAAYQLDLGAVAGDVRIVGLEGGEHPAFAEPPYYDPVAMQGDRVIIAAFSTAAADDLPRGRTRIATVHVRISGDRAPRYEAALSVSATAEGEPIPARVILESGHRP